MTSRLEHIKDILSEKKYQAVAIISGALYWASYFAQVSYTAGKFSDFLHGFVKWYVWVSVPLSIVIAALIGVSFALLFAKVQDIKEVKTGSATSFGGILAGLLAAGCPSCAVGVFPFVASLFGISATLASLPFGGIELQLLSVALLCVSIYFLTKPSVCPPK